MADEVTMRVWRGDEGGGEFTDYVMPAIEGEVVLDVIHRIQADPAPDLACRWNCKAGKCGSCSAEINGLPRLMCMTRMDTLPEGEPVTVAPMKTFPIIRDLVTDVTFNYEVAKTIPAFQPGPEPEGGYRMMQVDVERGQEFRKCIECFMCQDVCHVIRDHEDNKPKYAGPRFFIRFAELEMHPLDVNDRRELAHDKGLGMCNITKCCTEVCPEHIKITDNGIIPMKERVVDAALRPGGLARSQDHAGARRRPPKRRPPAEPAAPAPPRPAPPRRLPAPGRRLRFVSPSLASPWPATSRPNGWRPSTPHWARSTSPTPSRRPARARWRRPTARSAWPRWSRVSPGRRRGRDGRCEEVRVVLTVADGRAHLELDPEGRIGGTATIVLGYPDALSMARGELDPADALADGRVRVRGDLAALVAGQDVLAAAAARLGTELAELTDPIDATDGTGTVTGTG